MAEIFRVSYEPRFHVCFSRPEICALIAVATAHQDPTCRSAAGPGGFLAELRNMLEGPQDLPKGVEPIGERYEELIFSLDEVQLLGKILEDLGPASPELQTALLDVPGMVNECLSRKPLEEVV